MVVRQILLRRQVRLPVWAIEEIVVALNNMDFIGRPCSAAQKQISLTDLIIQYTAFGNGTSLSGVLAEKLLPFLGQTNFLTVQMHHHTLGCLPHWLRGLTE